MNNSSTWWALGLLIGLPAAAASCGSNEAGGKTASPGAESGSPGDSSAAAGQEELGGSAGTDGPGGSAGTGELGGSGGMTIEPVRNAALGRACEADGDCGEGLKCLTPDSQTLTVGGPPNGWCTAACTENADCAGIEPNAACYKPGDHGYCTEACILGAPVDGVLKCQGRGDFACAPFSDGAAALCVPLCVSDEQCGAGLFCDTGLGECVQKRRTGAPVGSPCDPTAKEDPCRGFCLGLGSAKTSAGVCAELCTGERPCMDTDGTTAGACYGAFSSQTTFGVGDIGYCNPTCKCTGDCQFPGDVCRAWSDPATEASFGAPGLCYPTLAGKAELTCKTDGGAP